MSNAVSRVFFLPSPASRSFPRISTDPSLVTAPKWNRNQLDAVVMQISLPPSPSLIRVNGNIKSLCIIRFVWLYFFFFFFRLGRGEDSSSRLDDWTIRWKVGLSEFWIVQINMLFKSGTMINLKIELKIYYRFLKSFVRVDFDWLGWFMGLDISNGCVLNYVRTSVYRVHGKVTGMRDFRKTKIIFNLWENVGKWIIQKRQSAKVTITLFIKCSKWNEIEIGDVIDYPGSSIQY